MALRLQVDGLLNAAGQVVKGGAGTPSALALSNDSSADAKPIGGARGRRRPEDTMADTHQVGVEPVTAAPGRATATTSQDVPPFSVAGTVLEAFARRDFGRLAAALRDDVHLRALLPGGFKEWHGRAGVDAAFTGWFDGFDGFELVDAVVGEVGPRLHFGWRLRVGDERLAGRWLVVEQQVYADVDADDQIYRLSLLCSGFCREGTSG